MREIKFRGKEESGKWVYGFYVFQEHDQTKKDESRHLIYRNNVLGVYGTEVDKETVGQYVGLKDKNDNQIYEGDIIRKTYLNGWYIAVVEWHDVGYYCGFLLRIIGGVYILGIDIKEEEWNGFRLGWSASYGEIIGNIYDNPELLDKNNRR
jgi:uncharacterized phage protein (TIGR01671 family)